MDNQNRTNSGWDPRSPDLTPASRLDPEELLRRVTGRVYALWQAEERAAFERRREAPGSASRPGGRQWRK